MVPKQHKSKRLKCSTKYRITKQANSKRREDRKDAKKNPRKNKSKKDPGIPNSWPFKEELLQQIEEQKRDAEAEKAKLKAERLAESIRKKEENQGRVKQVQARPEKIK